jgi:hypothetical protein
MTEPPDRAPTEEPSPTPSVEQHLLRVLWGAAQAPGAGVFTGADLTARLAEQGAAIPHQTVVALLQALAVRHYVRLVLVFDSELEVIVTSVAPMLADLLEPPEPAD